MSREQTIRIVPGAGTAILFVHGILGTPEHFAPFLPLVPSHWSVYNILLKGHCGSVRDFSAASMAAWKQQVHEALQMLLATHGKVIIAAHSMGTLFAIREATELPVTELFLLNIPLKVHITPQLLKTIWRVFRGNINPDDEWLLAAQRAYGIERDTYILRYLGWILRYLELFAEIRKTRALVYKLAIPCRVYLSLKDEMVSPKSGKFFENTACAAVKTLNTSGHFYYSPEDLRRLQDDFQEMVQRISD